MLGLVTIGQAPRIDVTASMFDVRAPQFVEAGALDGFDDAAIAAFAPMPGEHVLVTRLIDGREAVVGKERLVPYVQAAIDRVVERGATIVCVICTGVFPALSSTALLVFPDRLLSGVLDAIMAQGTLGVLMPHPGQCDSMIEKWATADRSVVTASASPYTGSDDIDAALRDLTAAGADAVVMDCMGFDRRMLADARAAASIPVMLANGLVGAILSEMIGDGVASQVGIRVRSGS